MPAKRILVVDASYSMGHEVDGESRFDRAKQMAREVIEAATPGDGFHVVRMAGTGPRVLVGRMSYQPDQVAAVVDEMTPNTVPSATRSERLATSSVSAGLVNAHAPTSPAGSAAAKKSSADSRRSRTRPPSRRWGSSRWTSSWARSAT